jgi:hypothetical protein
MFAILFAIVVAKKGRNNIFFSFAHSSSFQYLISMQSHARALSRKFFYVGKTTLLFAGCLVFSDICRCVCSNQQKHNYSESRLMLSLVNVIIRLM